MTTHDERIVLAALRILTGTVKKAIVILNAGVDRVDRLLDGSEDKAEEQPDEQI